MHRIARALLPAALGLSAVGTAAAWTRPSVPRAVAVAMPATTAPAVPPTTTTTAATTTTTTTARVPASPTAAPVARRAPVATTAPRPATSETTAAPVHVASGGRESCGWTWDAIRIDDGSSNEVTMNLDAPRRTHEVVTIFADFAGPDSPTAARTVTTDGAGQATATFPVSEDKRDWTITISATFASGGACPAETFTLQY